MLIWEWAHTLTMRVGTYMGADTYLHGIIIMVPIFRLLCYSLLLCYSVQLCRLMHQLMMKIFLMFGKSTATFQTLICKQLYSVYDVTVIDLIMRCPKNNYF